MVEDKQYMVSEEAKRLEKKIYKMIGNIIDYDGKKLSMGTFKTLADIKNQVYLLTMESKTPIEPSDDANLFPNARSMTKEEVQREKEYEAKHSKIIDISEPSDDARETLYALADNLKVIHQNQAGTPEQDQLMIDSNIFEALSKLPQPKPFSEAEIREILEKYYFTELGKDRMVKELFTLIPKAQGDVIAEGYMVGEVYSIYKENPDGSVKWWSMEEIFKKIHGKHIRITEVNKDEV